MMGSPMEVGAAAGGGAGLTMPGFAPDYKAAGHGYSERARRLVETEAPKQERLQERGGARSRLAERSRPSRSSELSLGSS